MHFLLQLTFLSVFSALVAANGLQKRAPSYCTAGTIENVLNIVYPTFCSSYLGITTATTTSTVLTTTLTTTTVTPTVTTTTTTTTTSATLTVTTTNQIFTTIKKRQLTVPPRIPVASVRATIASTLLSSACSCIATTPTVTRTITDTLTVTSTTSASPAMVTDTVTTVVDAIQYFTLFFRQDELSSFIVGVFWLEVFTCPDGTCDDQDYVNDDASAVSQCAAVCLATPPCNIFWIDNYEDGGYDCFGWDYPSEEAYLNSGVLQPIDVILDGQAWILTES